MRGALSARLLERIAAERPAALGAVDLYAGTSTGAILAVGLAKGLTPGDLVAFYRDRSAIAFRDTALDDIRDLGRMLGADYSTADRRRAIEPVLGRATLADLPKRVLIATFVLDSENPLVQRTPGAPRSWRAKFFHNYPGPDSDGGQTAVDVVMRSSAAPTYFPIYQGFIDGGVVANNPAMCALAQALHPGTGGQDLRDVALLSVGTGHRPHYIAERDGDWGLARWGPALIELLFDAGIGLADYQCRQLLGDCYFRLNTDLDRNVDLDAVSQVPALIEMANRVDLAPVLAWLDRQWLAA